MHSPRSYLEHVAYGSAERVIHEAIFKVATLFYERRDARVVGGKG